MDIKELIRIAKQIPELGYGGNSVSKYLIKYSSLVSQDHDIVEVGSFFGSGTSYLSIGLMMSENKKSVIHCYDTFEIDNEYQKKMENKKYEKIKIGNSLNVFKKYMKPFSANIKTYKGKIENAKEYKGRSIGLLVDDICFGKLKNDSLFKMVYGKLIPGVTIIILMDYCYYEKISIVEFPEFNYQKKFMELNKNVFEPMTRTKHGLGYLFRYLGGEINYEVTE
jgi:hypothetical protein